MKTIFKIAKTELRDLFYSPIAWLILIIFTFQTGMLFTGMISDIVRSQSMGGHGAMWISFRHKDMFGAAGSTSGGVDIRPFPNNWEMSMQLGKEADNREVWENHTVINQIDHLKNGDLAIIVDCGYKDFFFEVNNKFHEKLLEYKIDHDFIVRPGAHTGEYWKNSIDYQILFFKNFFNRR